MSTEKEPDYAGIAERETKRILPDTLPPWSAQKKGYASCMEARLRSDWETIRLLQNEQRLLEAQELTFTDALKSRLSKLLEPFT